MNAAAIENKINQPRPLGRGMVVLVRYLSRGLIPFLTALKGGVLNPSHTIMLPPAVGADLYAAAEFYTQRYSGFV
jgi:hypothetical protein